MPAARLVPIGSLCRESPLMSKGPHDMGGEPAGPIDTIDHGMRCWEKQANALGNALTSRKVVRLDELRGAAEELGERAYGSEGEPRRGLYRVRYRHRELWADSAGPESDHLELEIYEHWLERA